MIDDKIFRECKVLSVDDDQAGLRIKVRLHPEDSDCKTIEELPYCFPLIPKHFHINPKVGEMVLVILSTMGNTKSRRWFIGPVISQQYNLEYDPYYFSSRSLLDNGDGIVKPFPNPTLNPENEGSFPERDDVALQGRRNADLILKDNELRLRCGFKKNKDNLVKNSLIFNKEDLSYIQMKYKHFITKDADFSSVINIVADKINLLSHQSKTSFKLNDRKELITDEEQLRINSEAHPMIYGDELVEFLKNLVELIRTHTHPFAYEPPCFDETHKKTLNTNIDDMLSKSIKIN